MYSKSKIRSNINGMVRERKKFVLPFMAYDKTHNIVQLL